MSEKTTYTVTISDDDYDATVALVRVGADGDKLVIATEVFNTGQLAEDAIEAAFRFLMKVSR